MARETEGLDSRLRWCADELVDLILQRRERWWPENLKLAIVPQLDGDWAAVAAGDSAGRSKDLDLVGSIARIAGEVRARNAWDGF